MSSAHAQDAQSEGTSSQEPAASNAEAASQSGERPNDAPVLDVEDLVSRAVRSYPGMRAAEARIRAARAQLDEIWVTPFFQSNITAGFTLAPEARGSPIFSPDSQTPLQNPWQPVMQFGIEGVIPLWTFGKIGAAREAARAGIRAAESDRVRVRNQLLYDVRRAYFALQLALDLEQMLAEGMPLLQQAIERTETRLAEGDAEVSETDRFKLQAALAEVEGRSAQATHVERSARAALGILTGSTQFRTPDCPIAAVDANLDSLEAYVSRAHNDRPEVRMLEAARRAREASVDATFAGYFPDIGLAYRFQTSYAPGITDQTNPFVIDPANFTYLGGGLVMRWSLDVWGNAYRVDRETAHLEDIRARSEEAMRGIEVEVTDAYHTVVEAQAREVAYGRSRRETRAWFLSAAQGVELGTSEMNDLVDAVKAYFMARFNHLQAIHDLNTSLANLERTSGTRITEHWDLSCD